MTTQRHESSAAVDLGRSTKAALQAVGQRVRRSAPLTQEDELELARRADEQRGHHLSRKERSKRAYELTQSAPVVRYVVRPR